MTDSWTEEGWTEPAKAVDLLEIEINRREERDPEANFWLDGVDDYLVVKLPLSIARVVLDCARRGVPRERGGRADSFLIDSRMETFALFARLYKDKLVRDGRMNATDAEWEAARNLLTCLAESTINIAPSTLRRRMQSIGPLKPDADDVAPGD